MNIYFVLALFFIGIASVLFFLMYLIIPRKTTAQERLESFIPQVEEVSLTEKSYTHWQGFLAGIGKRIPLGSQYEGKYGKYLVAAGYRKNKVVILLGGKILLAVILPAVYLLLYGFPIEEDRNMRMLISLILAIVGFLVPSYWLTNKLKKRQTTIFHDLPDVLDLMTICVEAGISLDAAMIKVSDDDEFKKSPLVTEMKIAVQETRAGKPRIEALRDMGERAMVADLKSFAAMLIQTEKLGTSLAQSMRVFSDTLRTIRKQVAEEAAAKVSVKLLFPLVFFIFPALLVVILGPAMIRIMKTFGEM